MSSQQHIVSAGDVPPPHLPSICVDHLHAQCSLRERKTSCGNTKCPRAHITLPQHDTLLREIPELRTHLQYMPTILVAVDRRSKHSNPLVIRMPTQNALFTVGITKAVDCAFHGGQRVPYVCYDFLERTCAYGSQCYGIHVVDFDLQSVPRERFRAAVGERDMNEPTRSHHVGVVPPLNSVHGVHARTASGHHSRSSSQGSDRGPLGYLSFPTPAREVGIPVPDAYSMTYQETGTPPRWMGGRGGSLSGQGGSGAEVSSEDELVHPHRDILRMMHDGVKMVHAAHEANVALMSDVETYFAAAERVLRVAKQTCAQQCQAVVAKRLHDVSEHLQILLTLQRATQPPDAALRMAHEILMRNTPHAMRTVSPHETTVSFVGDVVVPRITYARHDGIVETVNPPVAHPPAGWTPLPGFNHHPSSQGGIPQSLSGTLSPASHNTTPSPSSQPHGHRQVSSTAVAAAAGGEAGGAHGGAPAAGGSSDPLIPASVYDEEEWAVVQLLQMVQNALTH